MLTGREPTSRKRERSDRLICTGPRLFKDSHRFLSRFITSQAVGKFAMFFVFSFLKLAINRETLRGDGTLPADRGLPEVAFVYESWAPTG